MNARHTIAAAFLALLAWPAFGATCDLSATGVSMGSYTPNQGAPADSAGSITISCTKGQLDTLPMTANYSLNISRGNSSSYSPRETISGVNKLNYNLYKDSSRLIVWGDATGGTADVSGALLLSSPLGTATKTHTVYGRIFGSQNAVPGAYADSIVVTVVY